jgi:hypothetical protein
VKRETRGRALRRPAAASGSSRTSRASRTRPRSSSDARSRSAPAARRRSSTALASQSKDELMRQATAADIEGRSSMTKAQLVRALSTSR